MRLGAEMVSTTAQEKPMRELTCYWCSMPLAYGVRVCRGCNADVVYRATRRERTTGAKWGVLLAALPCFVLLAPLADLGASTSTVGLTMFGLLLGGGLAGRALQVRRLRGKVRFFRRTNL
jgi:hypothetical protein